MRSGRAASDARPEREAHVDIREIGDRLEIMELLARYAASVRAMFYNPMRFPGADDLAYCGGWYHHRMVRTPHGWRSRDLREENNWFVNPPARWGSAS